MGDLKADPQAVQFSSPADDAASADRMSAGEVRAVSFEVNEAKETRFVEDPDFPGLTGPGRRLVGLDRHIESVRRAVDKLSNPRTASRY